MVEPTDRLTVVEMVYHHPFNEQPTGIEHRYGRALKTQEQIYSRRSKATEDGDHLNTGWVDNPGLLLIENNEGQNLQTMPSEDDRRDIASRIIEVYGATINTNVWLILPGECMRCHPKSVKGLRIRCQRGAAKYTLTAFPE